ncbi:MAG TPA: AI-2E family transporter, partial [Arenibaculum sp.]|nr:AI-2E family transporter [Arenibaculum sp.]
MAEHSDPIPPRETDGLAQDRPGIAEAARRFRVVAWLIGLILVILIGSALRATAWVTMPLAFAIFLAITISPVTDWVRKHVPRRLDWLAYVASMAILLAVLTLFVAGIWYAARQILSGLPKYTDTIEEWWNRAMSLARGDAFSSLAGNGGGGAGDGAAGGAGNGTGGSGGLDLTDILEPVTGYATTILNSATQMVGMLVLILFFVLLMLIEAPTWHSKFADSLGRRQEAWSEALTAIGQRFRWYVLVRTVLGLMTGLLYGLWLWAFGVDFVIVWGLLAFLLNFVPTVGSLIAGILPAIFAFFQMDLWMALIVGAGILVIEQIMGNYVDPRLQGKQLSLSPLMILVALMLWGWIWGITGTLLAVPMTVLIMIVFANIPALRPVALFLSDES